MYNLCYSGFVVNKIRQTGLLWRVFRQEAPKVYSSDFTAYLSGKRTEHRKVHVPILFGRNQSTTQPQ